MHMKDQGILIRHRSLITVDTVDDDSFRIRLVDALAHAISKFARRQFGGIELFDVDKTRIPHAAW